MAPWRRLRNRRHLGAVCLIILGPFVLAGAASSGAAEVTFANYPQYATAPELIARLFSPLAGEMVRRRTRLANIRIQDRTVDLAREQFLIYVPPSKPASGYGLLVFVPPWPQAQLPHGWNSVLDKYGIIFVSAERSGNDESVISRRIPLALVALSNVAATYPVDPSRTFVGGFSGGARVAMRIALAYPDKFAGALLDAGSDPIGVKGTPVPSQADFLRFQTGMRLVYATGSADEGALSLDSASLASMAHWCIGNVSIRNARGVGHEVADASTFDWSLHVLTAPPKADTAPLASCRTSRSNEAVAALDRAQASLNAGRTADAKKEILEADERFGGLAAPRSVALADRCNCGMLDAGPPDASFITAVPGR